MYICIIISEENIHNTIFKCAFYIVTLFANVNRTLRVKNTVHKQKKSVDIINIRFNLMKR